MTHRGPKDEPRINSCRLLYRAKQSDEVSSVIDVPMKADRDETFVFARNALQITTFDLYFSGISFGWTSE